MLLPMPCVWAGNLNADSIAQDLEWEFIVLNDPQANAFVVPGGKVVVNSGLISLMGTDDELAAVLSHEIAHVLARHIVNCFPL